MSMEHFALCRFSRKGCYMKSNLGAVLTAAALTIAVVAGVYAFGRVIGQAQQTGTDVERTFEDVVVITTTTFLGPRRDGAYSIKARFHGTAQEMALAESRALRLYESADTRSPEALRKCFEETGFSSVVIWQPPKK